MSIRHIYAAWKCTSNRRLFFAVLLTFTTMGIYSISFGLWLILNKADFHELSPSIHTDLPTAAICLSIGMSVMTITTVGWISAVSYDRHFLNLFIAFVSLLTLMQVSTGVLGISVMHVARARVRSDLLKSINRTTFISANGDEYDLKVAWDRVQKSLKCCGVDGAHDWYYSVRWPTESKARFVPDSCCDRSLFADDDSMNNCGKRQNELLLFRRGCVDVYTNWSYHHISHLNWLSFALLIIEAISLLFAINLSKSNSFYAGSSRRRIRPAEYNRYLVEMSVMERGNRHSRSVDRLNNSDQDVLINRS
ncbi:hypothetical protein KIN20_001585 [Parelaphostrongylus tenuis]|uniref:Tetraspanin n=1 Tax=Parelaphostrongylus tenuis TaxID=148309 RepID=A0AAD5LTW3_PARTN|nr:hypothetical protein KIN20_001585 [Parelaphostrongylus tenuis]